MRQKKHHNIERRAFYATRSLLRSISSGGRRAARPARARTGVKIAFIHNERRLRTGFRTGAAQINELMSAALATRGVRVRNFYPRSKLTETPIHLRGIANILFFYSLLEHKTEVLKHDIIQGTTYTPLPFLSFSVPVVCHFGSTIRGYLDSVPRTRELPKEEQSIFKALKELDVIPETDFKTLRPLEDIADIETVAASHAAACIATSKKVAAELIRMGVGADRVHVIHNAIEDFWFEPRRAMPVQPPHLVFLGRLGGDVFTLKLKGLSRVVNLYRAFPDIPKTTVCMTANRKLKDWLRVSFPKHYMYVNLRKDLIPGALAPRFGSVLFLPSRYEGFSLSLVEGMSQGLVPVSFPVGVAPEIIQDGVNGFVVPTMRAAEERVRELLGDDRRRIAMAGAAQETASQFRLHHIAEELLRLYRRIRTEGRARRGGRTAR